MPKLIGPDPNQVPTNADLGSLAYQDAEAVNLGQLLIDGVALDTSTPALRIKGYGGGPLLQLEDARATPQLWGKMAVDADTNLILGLTAAHAVPTAASAATAPHLQVVGHGDAYTTAAISSFSYSTNAYGPTLAFTRSQGSLGTHGQVLNGRYAMTIAASASDGTAYRQIGQIVSAVETATGTDDVSGFLSLWTRPAGAGAALTERLRINSAGNVGIGTTSLSNTAFRVTQSITGGTTAYSTYNSSTVQLDVTSRAVGYGNQFNTAAAAFTLANYAHFYATGGTLGAGSANTTQAGFEVSSLMTQGANNYGFYGNLATATGVYNLYMAGTALNYLNGKLLIGSTTDDGSSNKLQVAVTSGDNWVGLGGIAGNYKGLFMKTGVNHRWSLYSGNEAESGSNAGSNFAISRYADNGAWIDSPISINRANGAISTTVRPSFAGQLAWDAGNFNPALYMPKTGGQFTGRITMGSSGGTPEIQFLRPDQAASCYLRGWSNNGSAGVEFINSAYNAIRASLDDGGNWWCGGNVTAYSDERVKTDWTPFAEDFIDQLATVKYGAFTRTDTGLRQVGVGAQSLQKVIPDAVVENYDGMLSVVYGHAALASVVALAKEVVGLRQRVAALEAAR